MNAIILCAGRGMRLKDLTEDKIPKCLVKINNRTILDRQIDAMDRVNVENITVVTGFKAEMIRKHLFLNKKISFVHNDDYATTNILTSFWLALENCDCSKDFIIVAGDVVFDPEILKSMVAHKNADILIAMDSKKIDKEAVKITVQSDNVVRFGKDLDIDDSHGQFLGLMKVCSRTMNAMKDLVKKMVLSEGKNNAYLFNMLNNMIDKHKKRVGFFDIEDRFWEEIDFKTDWERANNIITDAPKCQG